MSDQNLWAQAGMLEWNPAKFALYAIDLAINQHVRNWGWHGKVDVPASRARIGLQDVALVRPALHDATLNIDLMLRNTKAFCGAWHSGRRGAAGSIGHYAGLIACQASQQEVPEYESRYAVEML